LKIICASIWTITKNHRTMHGQKNVKNPVQFFYSRDSKTQHAVPNGNNITVLRQCSAKHNLHNHQRC